MKRAIRVLALSALLVMTVSAAVPRHPVKLAFGGQGSPVPLCDPNDPTCTIWGNGSQGTGNQ